MKPSDFKRVVLESPFKGETETHMEMYNLYTRLCMQDMLERCRAPFASHAIYTLPEVLDDSVPEERTRGIMGGLSWGGAAEEVDVYVDFGISSGMRLGIDNHQLNEVPVKYQRLANDKWLKMCERFKQLEELVILNYMAGPIYKEELEGSNGC